VTDTAPRRARSRSAAFRGNGETGPQWNLTFTVKYGHRCRSLEAVCRGRPTWRLGNPRGRAAALSGGDIGLKSTPDGDV
jgi:hypothetical protein